MYEGQRLLSKRGDALLAFHPRWMPGQLYVLLGIGQCYHSGLPPREFMMKLEKELVREILLAVEAHDKPQEWMKLTMEGWSPTEVSYHIMLLDEAGLLVGISLGGMNSFHWEPTRLTYEGHEFLETVRDGEVWKRTKEGAEKVGGVGLGVLVELGKAYGKQIFKERLGIELP